MGLWSVVFVVLMILWLAWGGYQGFGGPTPNPHLFFSGLIPWACVAILGAIVLGGLPK